MTELEFLSNDANENEGLGDAGIATFQDRPYASAAKEAGQNSRDAMSEKPVKMVFKLHKIPKLQIPFIGKLNETIEKCIERVDRHYNEKEEDFFLKAQQVLENEEINVLEISDYSTKGLVGPAIDGKPFYALLKGSGVSDKGDETDGASSGSFGIGKNASFAISELRTVLYSTVYFDETSGQDQFLAQGKVKLVSHIDKAGKSRKATGWWGLPGFLEVNDPALVPDWMRRSAKGTSVFSVGFRVEEDWEYRVVAALVRTFFIAINSGEMEFVVGDNIQITRATLTELFSDPRVNDAVKDMHLAEDFDFARALYDCEQSPNADVRQINVASKKGVKSGHFEVRIIKSNGLPKRVGFVRNGMLITDNLKAFGHSFMRFPMCADFVALVKPANKETGALLKRLENPAHDQFSAERIADDVKRADARKVLESTGKEIRNLINEITKSAPKDVEAIDELAEFFADPQDLQESMEGEESINRYNYRSVSPRNRPGPFPGNDKGQKGGGTRNNGGSGGGGGGSGAGRGKGNTGPKKFIPLSGVRNIGTGKSRKIWFTPLQSGLAMFRISATGLSDSAPLAIIGCTKGRPRNGGVYLEFKENERLMIEVDVGEDYTGPIEVDAYREDSDEDQ